MIEAFLINSALVTLAVLVHYEALYRLSVLIPKMTIRYRFRVVIGLFGSICAHVIEIWLFAFGYYFMHSAAQFGSLRGNFDGSILDSVYFSFTSYTTLGFGDIEPFGPIRFLAGLEALTGLVLITWTASFMFFEMQKFWDRRENNSE